MTVRTIFVMLVAVTALAVTGCKGDEKKADEKKGADKIQKSEKTSEKTDEKKADEPKADEKKADEKKADEPKADEKKADEAAAPSSDKKPEELMVGTWSIDVDKTIEADPKAKAEIEKNPKMKEMMKTMMGAMSLTFGDGKMLMKMGEKEEKGTYKVIKSEGRTVTLETTEEGKDKSDTLVFEFRSDDEILGYEMKGGEKKDAMVLARKK